MIDYIIIRNRDIHDGMITKVMRGAECWTDHRLLRSKLSPQFAPPKHPHGNKPLKKLDGGKLKSVRTATLLSQLLADKLDSDGHQTMDIEANWDNFKQAVYEVSNKKLLI